MNIRPAKLHDVPAIVELLANDKLGKLREDFSTPLAGSYTQAFQKIEEDSNQELMVMESKEKEIIGTLQLSFIQYLTYRGGIRAQIEAVRIKADRRGQGLGEKLFQWAIGRAKSRGAHLVQLTTDKKRPEAIKFYEKIGFVASHDGMKMHLSA